LALWNALLGVGGNAYLALYPLLSCVKSARMRTLCTACMLFVSDAVKAKADIIPRKISGDQLLWK
jgi:hypothetical protein